MKTVKTVLLTGLLVVMVGFLGLVVVGFIGLGLMNGTAAPRAAETETTAVVPTVDHAAVNAAVQAALAEHCPTCGGTIVSEVNPSGWLIVTVTLAEAATQPRQIRAGAEAAVLGVRNALHGISHVENYRVSVNGPSPGPGLTLRYGSARMDSGSADVRWAANR